MMSPLLNHSPRVEVISGKMADLPEFPKPSSRVRVIDIEDDVVLTRAWRALRRALHAAGGNHKVDSEEGNKRRENGTREA